MSRCFRRGILGAAGMIAGTTAADAQTYPANPSSSSEHFVATASDSYAIDEADAEVVEFPRDTTEAPRITSAPYEAPRETRREISQTAADPYADERAIEEHAAEERRFAQAPPQAAPQCTDYQETVVAHGQTQAAHGTACQQADGSWRIISAPPMDARGNSIESADRPRPTGRLVQNYCREYQQMIVANGRERVAYGEACLQPDGSWRVVTPPSIDGSATQTHVEYTPAPRHITSASMRAQEREVARNAGATYYTPRPRRSPLYNLFFGWLD